ncbi:hypothetical protein [Methylocella sp.]|uniref:hypothetical protein n=1 Tax=Methylocella sp. TaxID=1978226 RepID=UPI0037836AA1
MTPERAPLRSAFRLGPRLCAAALATGLCAAPFAAETGAAQTGAASADQAPPKEDRSKRTGTVPGTPLDTIMNTKIWPDVPQAKDFVRASRPDEDALDYQPPWGGDPQRPAPRSASDLDALRRELHGAQQRNTARGAVPPQAPF